MDALKLQYEQFNLDKEKFGYAQEQDAAQQGLAQDQLGLQRDRLGFDQEQQQALEKHREFENQIAERQLAIQLRAADIQTFDAFQKVLDPTIPTPARQFLLKSMAGQLGIDPKSEQFKDISKMVTSLESDALTAIADSFTAAYPNMEPGQATAMAKGMLSGKIPPGEMFDLLKTSQTEPDVEPTAIMDPDDPKGKKRKFVTEQQAIGQEAPGPAPMVSIENKAEGAEATGLAGLDVKQVEQIAKDAEAARKTIPWIRTFRAAAQSGRFVPGTAASVRETLSKAAQFVGIDPAAMGIGADSPATAEIMEVASNNIALSMAEQLSRLTNMSLEFTIKSVPNIFKTPGGNLLAADMMEMLAKRNIAVDDLRRRDYARTLYPEGKPNFFEAKDRLLKDFADEDTEFQKRIQTESVKGQGIDWAKIPGIEDAKGALGTKRPTATNKDGKKVEWDGSAWVPVK